MRKFFIFLPMLLFLMPASGFSQTDGVLKSDMIPYRIEKDAEGKTVYIKTKTAAPGEKIEYRIVYHNTGDEALSSLVVDGPVPANTRYVGGSASGNVPYELRVSIDRGATWEKEPIVRIQKTPDGELKKIIVSPDLYTHIRWMSEKNVEPGEIQEFRYQIFIK
eukprot:NODE_1688_length_562_cov_2.223235_g1674_i0.p1 GENE.NODE_1688_length_562_cov_2.223235_g1674_i0~~NODE_1688_length_562_cov_2.223235_g1674_i0.p1  ORF type:complete len:163 (-),score=35.00 NODE_1688_length_562_cov_2.223235_g1674_i0:44-532(-)